MKIKNLKLLVKRLEAILDSREAAQFNMNYFGNLYSNNLKDILPDFPPVCNTQACLAGETVLATGSGRLLPGGGIAMNPSSCWDIEIQAIKDLGLTKEQALNLFYLRSWTVSHGRYGWPEQFEQMYLTAKTPWGRLYAAILRVKHFIKTCGRE
jgi:hypothetical protein